MPLILSIETSTSVCSVALHENGALLGSRELHTPQSAASQLAPQIETLLRETNSAPEKLNAVAVSRGPGSYTGLRIGVSTAKGICFALGIPLISVDSLLVLASQVKDIQHKGLICPMFDARRMEVYCCLLDTNGKVIEETQPKIIDESSFENYLSSQSILFFGDGSEKCRSVIRHPNAIFTEGKYPAASGMGFMAIQQYKRNQFEELETFEPRYLKEFVAKTKSAQSLL